MSQNENTLNWWDKVMMAATFAEANEHETAKQILSKRPETRQRKESGKRPELRAY